MYNTQSGLNNAQNTTQGSTMSTVAIVAIFIILSIALVSLVYRYRQQYKVQVEKAKQKVQKLAAQTKKHMQSRNTEQLATYALCFASILIAIAVIVVISNIVKTEQTKLDSIELKIDWKSMNATHQTVQSEMASITTKKELDAFVNKYSIELKSTDTEYLSSNRFTLDLAKSTKQALEEGTLKEGNIEKKLWKLDNYIRSSPLGEYHKGEPTYLNKVLVLPSEIKTIDFNLKNESLEYFGNHFGNVKIESTPGSGIASHMFRYDVIEEQYHTPLISYGFPLTDEIMSAKSLENIKDAHKIVNL